MPVRGEYPRESGIMRRIGAFLALALLAASSIASADEEFVVVGKILAGNPSTKRLPGITERAMPCGQPNERIGDVNGLDGYWIVLPEDAGGQGATLEAEALDADVWFYRATENGCDLIDANDDPQWANMATDLTSYEIGVVPAEATLAIVTLVTGREAPFTFRLFTPSAA